MIVVSDASPIINLATINRLNLLHQLYETILIPPAVQQEIAVDGRGQPGASELSLASWIEVRQLQSGHLARSLQLQLDRGEAEAIALAVELDADILLLDEKKARTAAARLDLTYVGLLGALVEAKNKALIPEIKIVIDELLTKAGFWIDEALYRRVLQVAGEFTNDE